jgi:gamma-glutamyltranspeptidase/glutathione hydrolase
MALAFFITTTFGCPVIQGQTPASTTDQAAFADASRRIFSASDSWRFPPGSVVPVAGAAGILSSTDRVASEIGVEILRRGGNAIDAAIATFFALSVVNPEAGNIGGGGFMLVHLADGTSAALDFREKAPFAATRDMFIPGDPAGGPAGGSPDDPSLTGHRSSGVPGSVAGMYAAHQRFGSLPWAELLQPAIHLAEGMVVHERLATSLRSYASRLSRSPATAAIFLPNGQPPRVGDRLTQPDLAATLTRIARSGHDGFYSGETARLIAAEMRRGGGLITERDLAEYQAVWREPIRFEYRDHTVLSMPPISSGGVTLAELLNILEGYDLASMGFHSVRHIHLWTEATRRAYADRNSYLGDPDFVIMPIAEMISDSYAARRRESIDLTRATPSTSVAPGLGPTPDRSALSLGEPENTTHFSVLDRQGNAVALTTTLNSLYGNAITVSGAGFLLNNEMDDFTTRPGEPNQFGLVQGEANSIEPGKRMLSAMTPTIVLDPAGRTKLVTGTPGGATIITTVAQIISNVVDFGMNAADATLAPRLHHQHLPDILYYEVDGLRPEVVEGLRMMGHTLEERTGFSGDTQTILAFPDGSATAVADPRRGGAAVIPGEERQVVQ